MLKLSDPVTVLPQISDRYKHLLLVLGISSVGDLLTHFPRYHKDTSTLSLIDDLEADQEYSILAFVSSINSVRISGGRSIQKAQLIDPNGETIAASWFNQPYLVKALNSPSRPVLFTGKTKLYRGQITFFPTSYELTRESAQPIHIGRITPQYRLTSGVSSKWLRSRLKHLLDNLDLMQDLAEHLSKIEVITKPEIAYMDSIKHIHFPDNQEQYELAKESLSTLELAAMYLHQISQKSVRQQFHAPIVKPNRSIVANMIADLPFKLTKDQEAAIAEILVALGRPEPMNRLLQGDVGSGKTIVAAAAALAAHTSGYQTVLLAPTTILAQQHFESFTRLLSNYKVTVKLVTGTTSPNLNTADVIIGTSAVLARQKSLIVKPGLVIVDEQHKFGVNQRDDLLKPLGLDPNSYPHFLDMSATPIPRTMAMALYDDIQVSQITTKPMGRLPVKTSLVPESKLQNGYTWINEKVQQEGSQVFWVCPLVEQSDKLELASAKHTFELLSSQIFPHLRVGLLHGKLKPQDKEAVMLNFAKGELDILVSTSVIEVGIDVPNASIIVIEGAERFGLAQLHQLRGRVGRGEKQSWCLLLSSKSASPEAIERLDFFSKQTDGLQIAEYDMLTRGPGEVYGTRQSGIPNLKIASFNSISSIKQAKQVAKQLAETGITQIELFAKLL